MQERTNKINEIQKYLLQNKELSSWQAFELFGDIRLSGTIWQLKHKRNMNIKSRLERGKNRYGNPSVYTIYYLESEENENV